MMHNPYTNRNMIRNPAEFFGRRLELQRAFSFISKLQSVSIIGDRRIGKSSMLNALSTPSIQSQYGISTEDYIFGYLDFSRFRWQHPSDFLSELVRTVIDRLPVGVAPQASGPMDPFKFEKLVTNSARAGFKLVFLLDEFDSILQAPEFNEEFQIYLRSLANGSDLAWVTASTRRLGQISSAPAMSSPFFNIFGTVLLGPLRREEAVMLIAEPSRNCGIPLEKHSDFVLDLAGLHPFLLQIACCGLYEACASLCLATLEAYQYTREFFTQETLDHFEYAWSHLGTTAQQAHIAFCSQPHGSATPTSYLLDSSGYQDFARRRSGVHFPIQVEAVRSALQHFHDPEYLAKSPLACLCAAQEPTLTSASSQKPEQAVQQLLKGALTELRESAVDENPRDVLYANLIEQVYVCDYNPRRIMADLALSERSYYRELKRALKRLTAILADRTQS